MSSCKIHNVGFYAPEPKAVYSMAIQKDTNKLAIARSDSSIEIWNLKNIPFIERTIPSNLQNFSIEGLAWSNNRLFSVGLHGLLVEYNLYSLCVKNTWAVTGESATCLDINIANTHIAVGTEHGYLNLFSITENGVDFEKFLDKQEGRIVCLKFDPTGELLVTGSLNVVRVWNVKSGHAIHKMLLGRSEAKKDTVVWCLEVLSDLTIFSGDSRGVLTLWDGKVGGQIINYQSHKADITALCLNEHEDSIYCAGADPLIINYEKVKVGQSYKWVKSIQRKIHEHDVRSLIFYKDKLYSAGVDSYLACSYHPPKTLIKYAPILQGPCVQVAAKARFILLRYSKHIEVWSLGETERTEDKYRGMVQLKSKPKKLLAIQKVSKNWAEEEEGEGIINSCISRDGQWIFLSTNLGFRLYNFKLVADKPKLSKVDDLDDNNIACVQAAFNDVHSQLVVALSNGNITVYDLEDGKPFITQTIEHKQEYLSDTATFLTVSSCGKYLVVGDPSGNIVVFTHTKDGYSYFVKLPRYQVSPTAMAVNPSTFCLVVAYSDSKIFEYDLRNKELTDFSRKLESELQNSWKTRTHPIRSITFNNRNKDRILLHDDSNIMVIDKHRKSDNHKSSSKVAKSSVSPLVNGLSESFQEIKIHTIQKYKHLIYLASLSDSEIVAVEVNPMSIMEKLPPAFAQKTFGAK